MKLLNEYSKDSYQFVSITHRQPISMSVMFSRTHLGSKQGMHTNAEHVILWPRIATVFSRGHHNSCLSGWVLCFCHYLRPINVKQLLQTKAGYLMVQGSCCDCQCVLLFHIPSLWLLALQIQSSRGDYSTAPYSLYVSSKQLTLPIHSASWCSLIG